MFKKKNNRACPRSNGYLLAKYKIFPSRKDKDTFILTSAKDIGCGGVRLRLQERLSAGDILQVSVMFPISDKPIDCKAKIVWIKRAKGENKYEAGLQFVDIDEAARKTIDGRVQAVLNGMKTR